MDVNDPDGYRSALFDRSSYLYQNVGYDSIFWVREAACTYAAMNQHQRSKLGSRGKAMRQIAQRMRQLFGV